MVMVFGIVQDWSEFGGAAWSRTYWAYTAARRKGTAEPRRGAKMPQQNQNALEIWTLALKFFIKTEVLHKLFSVISAGPASSKIQLPV